MTILSDAKMPSLKDKIEEQEKESKLKEEAEKAKLKVGDKQPKKRKK